MTTIYLNSDFYLEINEDGSGELCNHPNYGVLMGRYKITKEKMMELRNAIPFEVAKPKEEMFKGCDND